MIQRAKASSPTPPPCQRANKDGVPAAFAAKSFAAKSFAAKSFAAKSFAAKSFAAKSFAAKSKRGERFLRAIASLVRDLEAPKRCGRSCRLRPPYGLITVHLAVARGEIALVNKVRGQTHIRASRLQPRLQHKGRTLHRPKVKAGPPAQGLSSASGRSNGPCIASHDRLFSESLLPCADRGCCAAAPHRSSPQRGT
jgi:hypothetical protein